MGDFFGGGTPQSYHLGFADTADLYTITKIWKAEETRTTDASAYTVSGPIAAMEDKFRITVDKSINWDGSIYADPDGDNISNTGYVQVIKFTPATTCTFTYVSQCSNRGLCNTDDALCECFKGYTNDNCDTQSSLGVSRKQECGHASSAAVLSRTRADPRGALRFPPSRGRI